MIDAVKEADIIVTTTGCRDLIAGKTFQGNERQSHCLQHRPLDIEIDMAWLNKNYGNTKDTIKPRLILQYRR